ncbi:MAG TPA: hypothetical protein VGM67_03250 [Gemmatimonadaceae bacterium]|jgi:hypothetical protein
MPDEYDFDLSRWKPETAVGEGDARANDPKNAGFTTDDDRLYRSHFQRANQLADRAYEQVRPAYRLGQLAASDPGTQGRSFDEIEKDLENGWLNVRTAAGDWASVREFARAGFDRERQGSIANATPSGTSPSHDRVPFADPLPGNVDPTEPADNNPPT